MIELELNEKNLNAFLLNLRAEDKSEIDTLTNISFKKELFELCLNKKNKNIYFIADDENNPLALGGAYVVNDLNVARVWLLSTIFLNDNKKSAYRYVLDKINFFKTEFDFLYNYIFKSNFSSLRWLKKCGFKIIDLKNPEYKFFYFSNKENEIDLRYFTC